VTHYAEVAKRLADLRDAADISDRAADYAQRLIMLTEKYAKRPALMERIHKAGLLVRRAAGA
jgi:hypothetical protein